MELAELHAELNAYFYRYGDENNAFIASLGNIFHLAEDFLEILENSVLKDYKVNIRTQNFNRDFLKFPFLEKLCLVQTFLGKNGIEVDVEKAINNGDIDFVYYDFSYDNEDLILNQFSHLGKGYAGLNNSNHKNVVLPNNGILFDTMNWVHELSHYSNQPNRTRNIVSSFFTEAIAYSKELQFLDYLESLGYEETARQGRIYFGWVTYLNMKKSYGFYKMLYLFLKLRDLSKSSYAFFYHNIFDYEINLKILENEVEKGLNIFTRAWYVYGKPLAIYMYEEEKKNPIFGEQIAYLNQVINEKNQNACLEIIGLHDFGPQDGKKIFQNVGLFLNDLEKEIRKR